MDDLTRALKALAGKQRPVALLFAYYDGTAAAPLVSERLRDVYQDKLSGLSENWSAVVIDAEADRIVLEGLEGPDDAATQVLAAIVAETDLLIEADDAHQHALITGEGFLIVGEDSDDDGLLEVYAQHPATCHAFYDPEHPNRMTFAAKWYDAEDEKGRMCRHVCLYYANRIEEYKAKPRDEGADTPLTAKAFELVSSETHEYGAIPVFHLRPVRRQTTSVLQNVLPLQDAINILLTNMVVSSEFAAFPVKVLLTDDELPQKLKVAPNRVVELSENSKIDQFEAAELTPYLTSIEHLIGSLAVISRTPRHYFYRQGEAPSGEALRVMEAPLVKKVKSRITRFTPTWRAIGAFLLSLRKIETTPSEVTPKWADPATAQPLHDAQTKKTVAEAAALRLTVGLSRLEVLQTDLGYSEKDATRVLTERAEEKETETASLGSTILTQFSRGKEDTDDG